MADDVTPPAPSGEDVAALRQQLSTLQGQLEASNKAKEGLLQDLGKLKRVTENAPDAAALQAQLSQYEQAAAANEGRYSDALKVQEERHQIELQRLKDRITELETANNQLNTTSVQSRVLASIGQDLNDPSGQDVFLRYGDGFKLDESKQLVHQAADGTTRTMDQFRELLESSTPWYLKAGVKRGAGGVGRPPATIANTPPSAGHRGGQLPAQADPGNPWMPYAGHPNGNLSKQSIVYNQDPGRAAELAAEAGRPLG